METTVSILDEFQRADENPLAAPWSSTTLRLFQRTVLSTSQDASGRGVHATPPSSANQDLKATIACGRNGLFPQLTIASLAAGSPATLTTSIAHGVPIATAVRLVMFGVTQTGSSSLNPNGLVMAAVASGATTFTIASGITVGSYNTTNAVVMPWETFVGVAGRVSGAVAPPTTFQAGYVAGVLYESSVRRLLILRHHWDGVNADRLMLLAQAAVSLDTLNGSDLAIGQELRFTITDSRDGVRLRAFVNNRDDENPNLEVTVRGRDYYLAHGTFHLPLTRDAGYFAIYVGEDNLQVDGTNHRNGCALADFQAVDNFEVEEDNRHAGRTLKQLREDTQRLVNRGQSTNFNGVCTNQFLNDAQEHFLSEMGDLALFARRTESMVLKSDDLRRTFMPRYVERIDRIEANGIELDWKFRDYADDGIVSIEMRQPPTGGSYVVSYYRRADPLEEDDDRSIVPRRLDEVLVVGAALRVARATGDNTFYNHLLQSWNSLLAACKAHMNRQLRMSNGRLRARSTRKGAWSRWMS